MPATVDSIVEQISGMTAMELSELKKALEDKFGVTAAAPMGGMDRYQPGCAIVQTVELAPVGAAFFPWCLAILSEGSAE